MSDCSPRGPTRRFHVCIHDATPAYACETRLLLRGLAPLVGRRLSLGVVPDWHGAWPLAAHPDYCRLVREGAEERLLHGYFHRRARGRGPLAVFAGSPDEMNGLDRDETRRTIERGQHVFVEVFGDRGKHARSAVGMSSLPMGIPVEIECIVEIGLAPKRPAAKKRRR